MQGDKTNDPFTESYSKLVGLDDSNASAQSNRQNALSRQNAALVELSKIRSIHSGDIDSAVNEITECAARTLQIDRVGIWLYNLERTEIHCINQYCRGTNSHSSGARLQSHSYPNYFKALEEARIIAADYAQSDPRTREFTDVYLKPTGITSMIDVPIRTARGIAGIICHEHVGPARKWAPDECQFAGSIADFVCIALEAHERAKAESALKASEERIRSLIANVPDIILTIDRQGRILFINHTEPQYDRESVVGMSAFEYINPEKHDLFRSVLARAFEYGEPQSYELDSINGRLYSSRLIPFTSSDEVKTCLIIATDITEQRAAEAQRQLLESQLQHTQKLESLGVLAGGIAHDFNNLLVGILGNTTLVLESRDLPDQIKQRLLTVKKTAQRASELINQLLAYSGKASFVTEPVDLSSIIEEIFELLESSISKRVKLEMNLSSGLAQVNGDVTQIRQVILNLIINAAEACEDSGGTVSVKTSQRELSREDLKNTVLGEELNTGHYVILEISDNGCGMDERVVSRIFDPFYTTKFAGRGLGLAAVLGILRTHSAAIKVESMRGVGTLFTVYFPAFVENVPSTKASSQNVIANVKSPRGKTILVIDDEPIVRDVTCAILKSFGLNALCASCGKDGIALFEREQGSIDAVLLDMTMPDLNGSEVFENLRLINADIPILLLSGYSEQQITPQFSNESNYSFLQKPYLPETLMQKLNLMFARKEPVRS